jgi:hypothetical protein
VTQDPILHRERGPFAGDEFAEEYFLPAASISTQQRTALDPWVARFIGVSTHDARQLLELRWNKVPPGSLQRLRDWLLRLEPSSVLLYKDLGWIGLKRESHAEQSEEIPSSIISLRNYLTPPGFDPTSFFHTYGDTACRTYFIPGPIDKEVIQQRLKKLRFPCNELLVSFLHSFAGLREDTPLISGHFMCHHIDEWRLMPQDYRNDVEGFDEWNKGLMLYHARNGDGLIAHPQGRVGWWIFSEHRIEARYDDLEAFVHFYVDSLESGNPFDSYSHL